MRIYNRETIFQVSSMILLSFYLILRQYVILARFVLIFPELATNARFEILF